MPQDIDPFQVVDVPDGDHNYNSELTAFNSSLKSRTRLYTAKKIGGLYFKKRLIMYYSCMWISHPV
jgi:hypothetical protein